MTNAATIIGVLLIAYNVYEVVNEPPTTGTGSDDDPFRVQTTSPLLALIGFALILGGTKHG